MYTATGQLAGEDKIKEYKPLVRRLAHHMMAKLAASAA